MPFQVSFRFASPFFLSLLRALRDSPLYKWCRCTSWSGHDWINWQKTKTKKNSFFVFVFLLIKTVKTFEENDYTGHYMIHKKTLITKKVVMNYIRIVTTVYVRMSDPCELWRIPTRLWFFPLFLGWEVSGRLVLIMLFPSMKTSRTCTCWFQQ